MNKQRLNNLSNQVAPMINESPSETLLMDFDLQMPSYGFSVSDDRRMDLKAKRRALADIRKSQGVKRHQMYILTSESIFA